MDWDLAQAGVAVARAGVAWKRARAVEGQADDAAKNGQALSALTLYEEAIHAWGSWAALGRILDKMIEIHRSHGVDVGPTVMAKLDEAAPRLRKWMRVKEQDTPLNDLAVRNEVFLILSAFPVEPIGYSPQAILADESEAPSASPVRGHDAASSAYHAVRRSTIWPWVWLALFVLCALGTVMAVLHVADVVAMEGSTEDSKDALPGLIIFTVVFGFLWGRAKLKARRKDDPTRL